jgi:hypothetical protein
LTSPPAVSHFCVPIAWRSVRVCFVLIVLAFGLTGGRKLAQTIACQHAHRLVHYQTLLDDYRTPSFLSLPRLPSPPFSIVYPVVSSIKKTIVIINRTHPRLRRESFGYHGSALDQHYCRADTACASAALFAAWMYIATNGSRDVTYVRGTICVPLTENLQRVRMRDRIIRERRNFKERGMHCVMGSLDGRG